MNNMRRGFTLIELIFVIVIIGILAAVALPRFLETADAAHVSKVKAYAGTLSRTTMPPFWNKSLEDDNNGSVGAAAVAADATAYNDALKLSLKKPAEAVYNTAADFSDLVVSLPDFDDTSVPTDGIIATADIGGMTYIVACRDGNITEAPKCNVHDGVDKWLVKY